MSAKLNHSCPLQRTERRGSREPHPIAESNASFGSTPGGKLRHPKQRNQWIIPVNLGAMASPVLGGGGGAESPTSALAATARANVVALRRPGEAGRSEDSEEEETEEERDCAGEDGAEL